MLKPTKEFEGKIPAKGFFWVFLDESMRGALRVK
jgi:hypothetical protein